MRILNPLSINNWYITDFLKLILVIQFVVWILVGLEVMDKQIPILRQLISFIYLTFIPGFLILRSINIQKHRNTEILLYAVGISISAILFIGLIINIIYPFIGIAEPISQTPIVITLSIFVLVLCILSYIRDKGYCSPSYINIEKRISLFSLLFILFPFLTIFGTYIMNFYQNNMLLILLLALIALIPILVVYSNIVPQEVYPLAIYALAISLLFHKSLISMYITGFDIQSEYHFANLVLKNGFWDWAINFSQNGVLSVTILPPIYSVFCNMELNWVFKIVYPVLFAFVPLGLYQIFRKQSDAKIAFLATFFFMSFFVFYSEMLGLARQQIAELFLMLLILSMIEKEIGRLRVSFLMIAFTFALIVSHYGVSYLFMFYLISVYLLFASKSLIKYLTKLNKISEKVKSLLRYNLITPIAGSQILNLNFVLLYIVFTIGWYMFVSSAYSFETLVKVGEKITSSIYKSFLNPEYSQALHLVAHEEIPLMHKVTKFLHYISQFFILIGIFRLFVHKKVKRDCEYLIFSLVVFLFLFLVILLPYSYFGTTRLYHISLFFLAPFCITGGITTLEIISKLFRTRVNDEFLNKILIILSIFLTIFLLFNSGWVYELANSQPNSIALNNSIDYPKFSKSEIMGIEWTEKNVEKSVYYADWYGWLLTNRYVIKHSEQAEIAHNDTDWLHPNACIYLRSVNIYKDLWHDKMRSKGGFVMAETYSLKTILFYKKIVESNKIYTSGGSNIYIPTK